LQNISINDILGKKVLITGDVGAGKTKLARQLLKEALDIGMESITVLDMAPKAVIVSGVPIGGALVDAELVGVSCLMSGEINTPRLSARTAKELLSLADQNKCLVDRLLVAYDNEPSRILFVNDISIYLQRGDIETLWDSLKKAETVIANGYFGERFKDDKETGLSIYEKQQMEDLASRMDMVIKL
jgi:adenylate kinase family enzyme